MMQRAPIAIATRLQRRFLARFGRHIGCWSFDLETGVPRMALRAAS